MEVLSQGVARELDAYLMSEECGYSVEQLMEIAGLGVAQCVCDYADRQSLGKKILVLCGPGNNGGDGLVAARYLKLFGFDPTVGYAKPGRSPLYTRLNTLLDQSNVSVTNEVLKSDQMDRFDIIVDALFGFGFSGGMREPFGTLLRELIKCSKPIMSVDVPSGWDVNNGPQAGLPHITPAVLISLTLPKSSSKLFKGCHYLTGRFVPEEACRKFHIRIPDVYESSKLFCQLA